VIALAVLPVFGVLIAAPALPEQGCPSARQVTDAMQARFPISLVMPDQQLPTRSDLLRAFLDIAPDGTVVHFSLVDVRGETHLRRTLPVPGRGVLADCLALADTLAAIVERYLSTITYETTEPQMPGIPPAPPPIAIGPAPPSETAPRARAALVLVGIGWRMPGPGPAQQGEIEGHLAGVFELTRSNPRLAIAISAGAAVPRETNWQTDPLAAGQLRTATLRRFPLRAGVLLELPAGPGWVEPALDLGVDLLFFSSPAMGQLPGYQSTQFAPALDASIGYRLKVAGRFFIRPKAAIGFVLKRYDIGITQPEDKVVLNTPRASASFGIDTGVLFQ
jgi:hypothetical protein